MKRFLLLILLSIGLTNVSYAAKDLGTLIAYGYVSNFPMCKGENNSYKTNCVGTYKWTDGWEYFGEWKDDQRHGVGIFKFKDPDDEYFGESIRDAFSGSGIMTYPDGAIWAGEWKNDQVDGLGVFVEEGFTEQGIYSDGYFKNYKKYLPKNASKKDTYSGSFLTNGWTCNPGYQKFKNYICLKSNSQSSTSSENILEIPANAKASGSSWVCNSGYTKTGNTCTNTAELKPIKEAKKIAEVKAAKVLKAAQLQAQNYYNDLESFLKTNSKEYDTRRILELRKKNKVILTQPWNKVLEKNFAELKSFTATSIAFRDYHQLQNDVRQKAVLNELDKANTRLKNIEAYLNYFIDNNLTSEIALDVLDQIDIAAAGLKKQNLDELSKISAQLESFIAKKKLANDFKAFSKSLAKNTPNEPGVVIQKIDATDLVNFDFMKNANRSDYIALINLSGKAPHALLDLEGSIVFEDDKALSCFYQSEDTIKKDLKYYLYDKFSDKEYLVEVKGFECNQNNLMSYDLVFFEKGALIKETNSYVTSLAAAIANNELQLYKKVTKEDQDMDFAYRAKEVQNITKGIEEGTRLGFGALVIDNKNTNLCTDVVDSLGQVNTMNILANDFDRMGYGKSVGKISFNSVENTFVNVQRGRCGFIYAGEESLAKLLKALKSSGTNYDILPIWYLNSEILSSWECDTGLTKLNNKCINLPANAEISGSSWICSTGFTKVNNKCINLPANAEISGSSWVCSSGFTKVNNKCINLPANAEISGSSWVCIVGFTKTSKACIKTEELERIKKAKNIAEEKASKARKKDQLEAQNYYADITGFLKTNNLEFDIAKIVELMSKNKAILNESWNNVIEKNFEELKSFTASSIAFRDYHQLQNDIRQKVILNELDKANTRLKNINAYLINYVQNNITSDIAQDVLKQINMAKNGLQQQGLNELSRVSTLLEQFIADNQLSNEYLLFAESLAKNNPDDPEVSAKKIDATDLVEFNFMKKAILSDFIVLINLSGKAPHALLDLEGNTVFENDKALSCFYQSKNTIKKDLKYYLYDKISGKEFLVKDKGFECNQNNLLSYDLIFFEKGTLLKESESYVTSLTSAIANSELQFYKIITEEDQNKDFAQRQIKTINIIQGIEDEMILGFGSLIINNDNTTLCTDVDNTLGQRSIMNLLSNEFTRMGYGKSVEKVSFNNVEDTFANVQRGRCGFIYAGEETLANLLNAFKSSGTKYDVLPIWYSKKMVKNEQLRQEGKEQSDLINKQKIKEQIEKDQKLADLRAEADGVAKKEEQKRLRKLNRNIVKSHVQFVSKEAKLWLDDDSENTGEMLNLYPDLVKFMNKKLKERWKLDSFEVIINDYGLSNFRDRIIETFITDIKFTLKNNDLGEYEDFCTRIAILDDKEFDRLREPKAASCQPGELKSYKLKFDFQSSWVVQ